MVVTPEMDAHCVLQSRLPVYEVVPEHIGDTRVVYINQNNDDKYIYKIRFSQLGENNIRINYGDGKAAYLDFFVTEPLETLLKKRSEFITKYQQILTMVIIIQEVLVRKECGEHLTILLILQFIIIFTGLLKITGMVTYLNADGYLERESSYYIAEYAKLNPIQAEEQLWYDKNKQKWYRPYSMAL